jgi:hypothetical protein
MMNRKEFNVLQRNLKTNKLNGRRYMFNAKRKEQFKLAKEVQRCTDQDGSANVYDVCYEAGKMLKGLQQYRNIVGSIDQFDNLIKSEVDTSCQG